MNRFLISVLLALLLAIPLASTAPAKSTPRPKFPDQFVCGTGMDRTDTALAWNRYNQSRLGRAATLEGAASTNDQGNISILEDDGTAVIQPNRFDLANMSITFTPSGNGYQVQSSPEMFDNGAGGARDIALTDDDASEISLPFLFVFYRVSYNSVFLNSDGNLTFTASDVESTDRNLRRILTGPPRIAPFFNDLNPISPGRITVENLSDRVLFTWLEVGEFTESGSRGRNTFQVVLQSNGLVRFNYRTIEARTAVVALAPGIGGTPGIELIDFSGQTTPVTLPGLIAEVFAIRQQLDLAAVGQRFYETHQDTYDAVVVFTDFDIDLEEAFAFAIPVRNNIRGIFRTRRREIFDFGRDFGSARRLSVVVNMGTLFQYPFNPSEVFLGTNNTVSILGQEFGHRWLAYVDTESPLLLGRGNSHWSFLHNTFASVMEGNEIQDLGDGRFRTARGTERYSPLDQYIMGLRAGAEVPPWFVVTNPRFVTTPTNFRCVIERLAPCAPFVGLEFEGTRRDVTIEELIATVGPREPTFAESPRDFSVAFILITQRGRAPNPITVERMESIRREWDRFFVQAVDGRGTMATELKYLAPRITGITPANAPTAGGTTMSIVGSAFLRDMVVLIGNQAATTVFRSSRLLTVTVPPASRAGTVDVAVRNPRDGQSFTLSGGFTYVNPPTTEFQVALATGGSNRLETAALPSSVQVGHAIAQSGFGVAVFRSFAGTNVVSEAAVPASSPGTSFRVYAERGSAVSTGIAIAAGAATATVTLQLSDGRPATLQLPPFGQRAQFVHELFPDIGTSFFGTLAITSTTPVSVVALRGTVNLSNQFIMTTVPVTAGTTTTAETVVFPQIADGGGFTTEIILVNSSATPTTGTVEFSFSVTTDRGAGTRFSFDIAAGGAWRLRTNGAGTTVRTGFASLIPAAGRSTPAGTAVFSLSTGGNLRSEAGVPAQLALTRARLFGVRSANRRTGIAVVNRSNQEVTITLTPFRLDGTAATPARPFTLAATGHRAAFFDELISDLPSGFEGTVMVESAASVYAISLRGTTNDTGDFLMTTMPIADLTRLPSGTIQFPHIADGGSFTTEFLFMNVGAGSFRLQFFSTTGQPLPLSLR